MGLALTPTLTRARLLGFLDGLLGGAQPQAGLVWETLGGPLLVRVRARVRVRVRVRVGVRVHLQPSGGEVALQRSEGPVAHAVTDDLVRGRDTDLG